MGRGESLELDAENAVTGMRAGRERNASAYQELGMSLDEIRDAIGREPRDRSPDPRNFKACLIETPDGEPIVGLRYRTDYKAEEEWGVSELREAVTGPEPLRFSQIPEASEKITFFSDCDGMILHTFSTTEREIAWGESLDGGWGGGSESAPYRSFYETEQSRRLLSSHGVSRWSTVSELREKARELSVSPIPREKAHLISALTEKLLRDETPDQFPAHFQTGCELVLRADGSALTARVLRRLIGAARAGRLGIGSGSGPFAGGLTLFDAGDMTPGLIKQIGDSHAWHAAKMSELQPVAEELSSRGISRYFLGSPREMKRPGDDEEKLYFWLNGAPGRDARGPYPQPYGWYTLDELLDEKFIADARERRAAGR